MKIASWSDSESEWAVIELWYYGLFLVSWHARCNIVIEARVLEIRADRCFRSLTLVKINLFKWNSALCSLQSCLFVWPLLQTNILSCLSSICNHTKCCGSGLNSSAPVLPLCVSFVKMPSCYPNTTSMAVLTWLTSWTGTLLILLAGNVSGHHPPSIVWSGTMDPARLMPRILQMPAV